MAKRIPIIPPVRGISQAVSLEGQPVGTSRAMANMRPRDPKTGRRRIAQRSGQSKHTSAVVSGAGNQVVALMEVQYDAQNVTYTSAGSTPTISSTTLPAGRECFHVVTDRYGNVYAFDGPAAIAKYNPDGNLVWKHALPAKDPGHVCRALHVDDSLVVFAGTSAGSNQKEARLWAVRQLEDDKTEILWEIETERWVESIADRSGLLYTIQNDTDFWKSYVVEYVGQDAANPTETRRFPVSYPVNGFTISPKDGTLCTTHEPNTQRGLDPRSPGTTAPSVDWTPLDLEDFNARVWSWYRADDVDGNDTFNSEYEDGDPISLLVDRSGKFRNLFQTDLTKQPILRKGAVAGRDVLLFDGDNDFLESGTNVSVDPAYRDTQRTICPMYKKAQFVLFVAVRTTSDNVRRGLLNLDATTAGNNRFIAFNRRPGNTVEGAAGSPGEAYEGQVNWYEDDNGSTDPGGGSDGFPFPGCFDEDGYVLIAVIHDGGQTDVAGQETRSTLWINGSPCDRWISAGDFTGTAASTLGSVAGITELFQGYFLEALCLSDWSSPSYTLGSGNTLNRLITYPTSSGGSGNRYAWPDETGITGAGTAPNYWDANNDTEWMRLHGYFGHRWGISHKLPGGKQNVLVFSGTPANNDQVVISTTTYTFKTTLTGAANEVFRGPTPNVHEAIRNLHRAINGTGTPGTDYGAGTVPNAVARSVGVLRETNSAFGSGIQSPAIVVRTREGSPGSADVTSTETGANSAWQYSGGLLTGAVTSAGTTTLGNLGADGTFTGGNIGFYPNGFWLTATPQAAGGPPRTAGITSVSVVGDANKPYGMVTKYDPASGKPRWCCVSDAGNDGVSRGGLGYGVVANSAGELYCTGPRQPAGANDVFGADNVDVRKVVDLGDSFNSTAAGSTATSPWTAAPGAQTYQYARPAIDAYDNVYIPIYQGSNGTSLIGYSRTPSSGAGVAITTVTTITDDPRGHAVAVDPRYPDYPVSFTDDRAEFIWLATELAGTNTNTLFKLALVTAAQTNAANRTIKRAAVAKNAGATGMDLVDFTNPGSLTTIASNAFSTTSRFIDWVAAFGRLFITDGNAIGVWSPKTSEYAAFRSTSSGAAPLRPRLLGLYRGRIVAARFEDNPYKIAWSKVGKPFNWDTDPAVPTADEAVDGTISQLGEFPDMVTGLLSVEDDLLLIGGSRTVKVLRGDPAAGGVFDDIKCEDGMSFGRARCLDPYGGAWFVGTHGGLYYIGHGRGYAEKVSDANIPELLADLDTSAYRVELVWNVEDRVIQIAVLPYSTGDTLKTHWCYDPAGKGFFPDTFGTTSVQPTSIGVFSGDTQSSRVLLLGSRDGYIRLWDKNATSDDTVRIDSYTEIELAPEGNAQEITFNDLELVLASDQQGCAYEVYAPEAADTLGVRLFAGMVEPGRNPYEPIIVTGRRAVLRLRGLPQGSTRFALESASIEAEALGEMLAR